MRAVRTEHGRIGPGEGKVVDERLVGHGHDRHGVWEDGRDICTDAGVHLHHRPSSCETAPAAGRGGWTPRALPRRGNDGVPDTAASITKLPPVRALFFSMKMFMMATASASPLGANMTETHGGLFLPRPEICERADNGRAWARWCFGQHARPPCAVSVRLLAVGGARAARRAGGRRGRTVHAGMPGRAYSVGCSMLAWSLFLAPCCSPNRNSTKKNGTMICSSVDLYHRRNCRGGRVRAPRPGCRGAGMSP